MLKDDLINIKNLQFPGHLVTFSESSQYGAEELCLVSWMQSPMSSGTLLCAPASSRNCAECVGTKGRAVHMFHIVPSFRGEDCEERQSRQFFSCLSWAPG